MNKQEMLNKAREIKEESERIKKLGDAIQTWEYVLGLEGCKKQLQEIKDKWKDGCGKETEWANMIYSCGNFEDLKHSDHYIFCPTCEKQNKEFKEICLEVLE